MFLLCSHSHCGTLLPCAPGKEQLMQPAWVGWVLAVGLISDPATAAESRSEQITTAPAPPEEPAPPDMRGTWAKHGRCDRLSERLTITAHAARYGRKPFRTVT